MNIPASLNTDEEKSEIHMFIAHFQLASAHSELHATSQWEDFDNYFWETCSCERRQLN